MKTKFKDSLAKSIEDIRKYPLRATLTSLLPGFIRYDFATAREDRKGTDIKATTRYGEQRIDIKIRSQDPRKWGEDDLAIELYSVFDSKIRGYQNAKTDWLLWLFTDSKRAVLIKFQDFRKVYDRSFAEWEFWLAEPPQETSLGSLEYQSQCAFVPFRQFADIAREVVVNN